MIVTYVPRGDGKVSVYTDGRYIGSGDTVEEAREMAKAYERQPWETPEDDPPDWFLVVYVGLLAASAGAVTYGGLSWL